MKRRTWSGGIVLIAVLLAMGVGERPAVGSATTGIFSFDNSPSGGTVVHQGNIWHVWVPSNRGVASGGTASVVATAFSGANSIAIGSNTLKASGSTFSLTTGGGYTVVVCKPGASGTGDFTNCDHNEQLNFDTTDNHDFDLGMITLAGQQVSGFSEFVSSYELTVPGSTSSIAVGAQPADSQASYTVNGNSGPQTVSLNPTGQDTVITVTCTAAAGGIYHGNYTITVHRGLANADLTNLTISPGSISFDGGTSYSTNVSAFATSVTVTPTLSDANASYQLKIGDTVYENPVPLGDTDPTTIDVVVTAENTTTTKTYSIAVSHLGLDHLQMAFAGNGGGHVAGDGIDCDSSNTEASGCSFANDEGTQVNLTATPNAGSYFAGWSDGCSGSASTTQVTLDQPFKTCTAEFDTLGTKQTGSALKVNTGNDDAGSADLGCYTGRCTLRDALASVPSKGTISFDVGVSTVMLDDGLDMNRAGVTATINGAGVTVDASNAGAPGLRLDNGTLVVSGLAVDGGGNEVGIYQAGGTLTLNNVEVFGGAGGGVVSHGTLTMTGGSVHDSFAEEGGGIFAGGTTTLTNVSVTGNEVEFSGGGIFVDAGAKLTMTGGAIDSNLSLQNGGGITIAGTATITNTTIDHNNGGFGAGLLVDSGAPGSAVLTNVTLLDNQGDWALTADGPAVAKLLNTTVVANQGGVRGSGAEYLNTLFAFNNGLNCDGGDFAPKSLGFNVIDDDRCGPIASDHVVADAHLRDPVDGFVPLDNGSAGLDGGTKAGADGLTVPTKDAHGTTRPQGAAIDVGALEMAVHKLTVKTAGPGTGTVDVPSGSYVGGSTVQLTATPTGSSAFGGWSGGCAGNDLTTQVVMNADKVCTATFAKPPTITSFAPSASRIRSTVTINGSGFTGTTDVTFNLHPAASFKVVSDTKLTAVVPDDAESGAITVTNAAGDFSTVTNWNLVWVLPKIASLAPSKAGGGATVTLTGTGFLGATDVDFNGAGADSFTVVSDTKIAATVPADATTGPAHVTTPGGTAASKASFTFIPPPAIDGLSPDTAPVGATITINGSHLTGATVVSFNGATAKPKTVTDGAVTVVVPELATTGDLSVTTPGGTTVAPAPFTQSFLVPTIASFTPVKGPIRTKLTITGSHFRGATELSFGGHDAGTWTIVSDTKITATVPDSATTGVVAVTNPAGTGASLKTFTVTWPVPKISSFAPLSGVVGDTVTINGSGFLGATNVVFSTEHPCDFTVVSATTITATVCDGAVTGTIQVITPGGTATSAKSFTVN